MWDLVSENSFKIHASTEKSACCAEHRSEPNCHEFRMHVLAVAHGCRSTVTAKAPAGLEMQDVCGAAHIAALQSHAAIMMAYSNAATNE